MSFDCFTTPDDRLDAEDDGQATDWGWDWQARRDSNPQHPDLESGALPLELLACKDAFEDRFMFRAPQVSTHGVKIKTPGLTLQGNCK
jgi:hypothetical protein